MTLAEAVRLALLASIWLIVFALGARASVENALFVLRRPLLLLRALAAMFVVAPAFAIAVAAVAPLPAPIRFALVAMSIGPVPPILPKKQLKAGGGTAYATGLLVAASLIAIVATPLLVSFAGRLLGAEASVAPGQIARTLLISVGLPLGVGMAARALWKGASETLARYAQRIGGLLLLVAFLAMVLAARREIFGLLGNGSGLAIAAAVCVGLAAGHLLSGGREEGALALAAASRHPGVALAIAESSFPAERPAITAAILLYLIVTALVTLPYVRWMQRRAERTPMPAKSPIE
jgi:BASS family bile acid:Na+ symporter